MKKNIKIINSLLTNSYIDLDIYNTNDDTNNTALDLAINNNLSEITKLLKNYKSKHSKSNELNYIKEICTKKSIVTFRTMKYLNNFIEKLVKLFKKNILKKLSVVMK